MKNKKLIMSIVAVSLVLVISVLAVIGIRNNEPKVEDNSTSATTSTTESTTEESTTESTTVELTDNLTTESTTKETTTSKKEEKTTVKNTKPVTTTKKQETTTKKQLVFNPQVEYPKEEIQDFRGYVDGDICNIFTYKIIGYSIEDNDVILKCELLGIKECSWEEFCDVGYNIKGKDRQNFDNLPVKMSVDATLDGVIYTSKGTVYDLVNFRSEDIRECKVGSVFSLESYMGCDASDYEMISKIIISED